MSISLAYRTIRDAREEEYRDARARDCDNGRYRFSPDKLETFQSAILLPEIHFAGKKSLPGDLVSHERPSKGKKEREKEIRVLSAYLA